MACQCPMSDLMAWPFQALLTGLLCNLQFGGMSVFWPQPHQSLIPRWSSVVHTALHCGSLRLNSAQSCPWFALSQSPLP
ncbi:hypothetical protein F5J12DRAFT_830408 [Pisolithus orientalis]|uniref:uncharacterized protein n=1 Tax=Pisolithus orientalis TaxID=936130 RepID=UPI0022249B3A|nr:uncharacterized protein F5J12DRAFT_830408 [Pisolithus orientalis]KAI6007745.1 hypothetical protein F5J12DRAFT_830408 [Pisolithus orientalis]